MDTYAINQQLARQRSGERQRSLGERMATMAASGELTRRLLVALPLAAVGFSVLAFGGVYGWAYGASYLVVMGALALWCVLVMRGRLAMQWRWVYLPLLAGGLECAWQYVGRRTAVPADSLTAVVHLAPAAGLFFLVSQCLRPDRDAVWISRTLALFTLGLAVLAIVQLLTASNGIYWHFRYAYASPAGPYINRNHFAGCMELLIPTAAVRAYHARHQLWQLFAWSLSPAMGIGAVLLSASRGGTLALLLECGLAVAVLAVHRLRAGRGGRAGATARTQRDGPGSGWLAMALFLTVVLSMVAIVGTQRLTNRLARFTMNEQAYKRLTTDTINVEKRDALNASSLAMWRQRPIIGWGIGTWASVYPAYATFDDGLVYEFAHNDFLQYFAETGMVGAVVLAAFWGIWLWRGLLAARAPEPAGPFAAAAVIACVGLLAHSWVDFNLHIPANLLLFLTMAAYALPGHTAQAGPARAQALTVKE